MGVIARSYRLWVFSERFDRCRYRLCAEDIYIYIRLVLRARVVRSLFITLRRFPLILFPISTPSPSADYRTQSLLITTMQHFISAVAFLSAILLSVSAAPIPVSLMYLSLYQDMVD